MSIETLVAESVQRVQSVAPPMAETPEAFGDRLRELIDGLVENLKNVDPDEAAAILAKLEESAALAMAGNWLAGGLALVAALRMYRKAIKS